MKVVILLWSVLSPICSIFAEDTWDLSIFYKGNFTTAKKEALNEAQIKSLKLYLEKNLSPDQMRINASKIDDEFIQNIANYISSYQVIESKINSSTNLFEAKIKVSLNEALTLKKLKETGIWKAETTQNSENSNKQELLINLVNPDKFSAYFELKKKLIDLFGEDQIFEKKIQENSITFVYKGSKSYEDIFSKLNNSSTNSYHILAEKDPQNNNQLFTKLTKRQPSSLESPFLFEWEENPVSPTTGD